MGAIWNQVLVLGAVCLASCEFSPPPRDLRKNPALYESTGYRARVMVDRAAFLAPLVDERAPIAEASGPYPRKYYDDAVWDRPMLEMVEEILADEIRDSGIFTLVQRSQPDAETLVVTPYLRGVVYGEEEQPHGRRSLAEIELRLVVHGAGESVESRPVLFDRAFREVAQTPVSMLPTRATSLVGIVLHK
ncbi:MAG: hypothetical protein KDB80_15100, partial [Planctomycetes bacterium]|nr:hypothetical protein [Planctomycetota bacterium]